MWNDLLETILLLFFSSVFASSVRLSIPGDDSKRLVSSAKRLVKKKILLGANRLLKEETAGGPRTLPWETPHVIIFSVEKTPFIHTHWVLLIRLFLNQVLVTFSKP